MPGPVVDGALPASEHATGAHAHAHEARARPFGESGAPPGHGAPERVPTLRGAGTTAAIVAGWIGLLVVANRWGEAILSSGRPIRILAPPIIGRYQLGPDHGFDALVVAPVLVALGGVVLAPVAATRLRWRTLCWAAAAGAAAFAVGVALVDGWYWLQRPMELPGHYVGDVGAVGNPLAFLRGFTENIDSYGTHVRGHPPGFLLLLWGLDRLGLGGSGWAAALVIAGGAATAPAVLVGVREVADEAAARRVAPFLVCAPLALYVATTADALFAGVGAWAVTAVLVATGAPQRRVVAFAGGVAFGVTVMFSYGLVLLAVIPLVVATARRALAPIAWAVAGGAAVIALVWVAGFSWAEGLGATRVEYLESVASVRPYSYFIVANLAALALVVGPAVVVGLFRLRDRRVWLLVGGALAAVLIADVSGMSKGEVERIWLPFAFWLVPATAGLVAGLHERAARASVRVWLTVQVAVTLAVQLGVRTHW